MSYEHIMKTQAQWEKTSAKYMLIPEGVLCIEVIDQDNMNLKIGDGNRTFAQLPYVNSSEIDLSAYAKKTYVDAHILPVQQEVNVLEQTSHTHTNKVLLDTIVNDNVHTHSNLYVLNSTTAAYTTTKDNNVLLIPSISMALESVITELGQVVHTNTKGQPDGVASLNASGVVPEAQIDRETIHGYYNGTKFYTDSAYTELITPRSDRFYIDHVSNRNYRYENVYIKLSSDGGGGQTYQPGTGLDLDEDTFNHSNAISPGTAKGSDTKTLEYGGTFEIPSITYDAQGHVTGKGTTTMTMPQSGGGGGGEDIRFRCPRHNVHTCCYGNKHDCRC